MSAECSMEGSQKKSPECRNEFSRHRKNDGVMQLGDQYGGTCEVSTSSGDVK
jgi:hypothetical protein